MATEADTILLARLLLSNAAWIHDLESHDRSLNLCRRSTCQQQKSFAVSFLGGEDADFEAILALADEAAADFYR